ncbi:hypothetical protein AB4143_16895 [Vibrio breoganii]
MKKALSIFIPTFIVVMIVNQMGYGNCYASHCLTAAFPKVTFISLAISTFIYFVQKSENK